MVASRPRSAKIRVMRPDLYEHNRTNVKSEWNSVYIFCFPVSRASVFLQDDDGDHHEGSLPPEPRREFLWTPP